MQIISSVIFLELKKFNLYFPVENIFQIYYYPNPLLLPLFSFPCRQNLFNFVPSRKLSLQYLHRLL